MRPRGVDFVLLLDACFRETEIGFLDDAGKRAEDVALYHAHHHFKIRHDDALHVLGVLKHEL